MQTQLNHAHKKLSTLRLEATYYKALFHRTLHINTLDTIPALAMLHNELLRTTSLSPSPSLLPSPQSNAQTNLPPK